MGISIVVTSGKGGVGKTTTSSNIGAALAELGKSVVLIDGDVGLRNLDIVLGLENRIVFDLVDVIEGKCRPQQAMIKDKRFESLFVIPASQSRDKDSIRPEQMKRLVDGLKEGFDYVIVDCPAGIEGGFRNAIAGADRAVVVVTPEVSSIRDSDRIIGLLEANGIRDISLIINRVRPHMVEDGNMLSMQDVIDILAVNHIGTVPDDEELVISTNKGEPVVLNKNAKSGIAYTNIAHRIMGEKVEFLNLEVKEGFGDKLKKLFKAPDKRGVRR